MSYDDLITLAEGVLRAQIAPEPLDANEGSLLSLLCALIFTN